MINSISIPRHINSNELKVLLLHRTVVLVDVREPLENKSERIRGSLLIPLGGITKDKLPSTSQPIVIHCGIGKRSEEACKKLLAEDPNLDVCFLEGGIKAWKNSGFPIESPGNITLRLERQIQVAAGSLTLLGIVLGVLINQWFYAIAGFAGLGLIFTGISGWCGLKKLLAKMPWNK